MTEKHIKTALSVLMGVGLLACTLLLAAEALPTRADLPPLIITVELTGLWKDPRLASRYVITNQGGVTATTLHSFYNTAGSLVTTTSDPIPAGIARIYDLGTIADIPVGYRGSVTVTADHLITGALVPFPVYLPLVLRSYRPPPPPPVYPNDPSYGSQWGLTKVRAPEAWAFSKGEGVFIAVLDTGADFFHPDLIGKLHGDIDWDFVNNDDDAQDDNWAGDGHGTHVSGIAAAATDNNTGVAGLGWRATVLPLKVMDYNGSGYADALASSIYYAADRGAKVINMSLGGAAPCPDYLQTAVDYAYSRGVLLVAAAGNDGGPWSVFPANCNHVLGVAATTSSDTRAFFSNYGSHVSVAAPGVSIFSTCLGGGYCYMQGTSMATPFVAGLAALVYAQYSTYTPDRVASAILDNAQDLGTTGWDSYYGCGRIDAFRALWDGARGDYPVCLGARVWSAGAEGRGRGGAEEFIPGEIVVTLRAGARAEALFRAQGLTPVGALLYQARSGIQVWRLQVPVGQEEAVLARLRADPAVIAAGRNYIFYAQR